MCDRDGLLRRTLQEIRDRLKEELASVRWPAMYGYEREGIPANKAFAKEYAEGILRNLRRYAEMVRSTLASYLS